MTEHEQTISRILVAQPENVKEALDTICSFGQIQGDHHRAWVIDQVTRKLLGDQYNAWVEAMKADGEYSYDEGIAP